MRMIVCKEKIVSNKLLWQRRTVLFDNGHCYRWVYGCSIVELSVAGCAPTLDSAIHDDVGLEHVGTDGSNVCGGFGSVMQPLEQHKPKVCATY
jgi:hypothetical protein